MTDLHVVALSGGKDSTAMAIRLAELHPDREFIRLITPTGNELPSMYAHWKRLSDLLGPLTPVLGGTLEGVIKQEQMIPNWRARFCTRQLKIAPYASWLMEQAGKHGVIHSYIGIRADEPEREAGDYTDVPGVRMVFPMREWGWGVKDVWGYLREKGVSIPPRTDCAWCFFQRLPEWWALWREYPDIYLAGEKIEEERGHTFRSPGRDTQPASLKGLREKFEAGYIPRGADVQGDMFGDMKCRVCRI